MLTILDRYIGRAVVQGAMLTLLSLVGLSALIKFVEQLRKVGDGSYDIPTALLYVLLKTPKEIELFFPMAALLGSLVVLGNMANSSELVVMQSAGISRFRIAKSVFKTALPLMLLIALFGEYVAPTAENAALTLRREATQGTAMISSRYGVWAKDKEDFVSIRQVDRFDELQGLTLYHFDAEDKLTRITYAERAVYANKAWQLQQVTHTFFSDERIDISKVDEMPWASSLTPNKLSVVAVKPEDMSLRDLYGYIGYLKGNAQEARRYELAFWKKLIAPFTILVTMLIALSFVFGSTRSVSTGARLLMGIGAGFAFYSANELLAPIALVYQVPPFLGALIPSLLFTAAALWWLNRSR